MKKVFLSYAHADGANAKKLFEDLSQSHDVHIWYDREDILPGMKWKPAIRKAIRESRYFVALMSSASVAKRGFRHSELSQAVEILTEFPDDQIYLVPTRLDECDPPFEEMRALSYADLFPDWNYGVGRLKKSLGIKSPKATDTTGGGSGSGHRGSRVTRGGRIKRGQPLRRKKGKAPAKRKTAIADLAERSDTRRPARAYHYQVGLIDLQSKHPELKTVARELNKLQTFCFLKVSGLSPTPKALMKLESLPQLYLNDLSPAFYKKIAPMKLDHIICVTNRLLAFRENGHLYWNYLAKESSSDERLHFVSSQGLEDLAEEAGVRYEHAMAYGIVGDLVSYFLDVGYHETVRGCPMDFTEDHSDIVKGLKKGKFCSACSKRLSKNKSLQKAVSNMLAWTRSG